MIKEIKIIAIAVVALALIVAIQVTDYQKEQNRHREQLECIKHENCEGQGR